MASSLSDTDLHVVFAPLDITAKISNVSSDAQRFGGLADVYEGILDADGGQVKVAIKFIRSNDREIEKIMRRHRREVKIWHDIKHPYILPLLGLYWGTRSLPAMVSTWCEYGNIKSYLQTLPSGSEGLVRKHQLLVQIAEGLAHLHGQSSPIVHGDLKGDNILVSNDGIPKICDFGLSKITAVTTETMTRFRGTLRWMAPELLLLDDPVATRASDIWAYACIMIEVFSGSRPYAEHASENFVFVALSQRRIPPRPKEMSDACWELASRCFEFEPGKRITAPGIIAHHLFTSLPPHVLLNTSTRITSVYEQAAKEKATAEKENAAHMSTMSRGGSRRGDNRSDYGSHTGADGWSTPAERPPPNKVGDLSQFGKINKASPEIVNLGPSSVFAGKNGDKLKIAKEVTSDVPSVKQIVDVALSIVKLAEKAEKNRAPLHMLAEKAARLAQLVGQVVSDRTVDGQLVPLLERLTQVLGKVEAFMLKETAPGNALKKIYRSVFVLQKKTEDLSNELETEIRDFKIAALVDTRVYMAENSQHDGQFRRLRDYEVRKLAVISERETEHDTVVFAQDTEETPKGTDEEDAAPTPDESEPPKKVMSEAEVKKQIENDTKEFFAIKKLDEGEQYFESLPEDQRHKFVDSIFSKALEGKDPQATLAGELFAKVLGADKITPELLEQGFSATIELLEDVAVDAPAAYALTAKMLYLSKFDEERVGRLADNIAVEGDPLVKPKDKLLKEFKKLSS